MILIDINTDKYIAQETFKFDSMSEQDSVIYKNKKGYDIILKNNDSYFFCFKIKDAIVLEESEDTSRKTNSLNDSDV